MPTGTQGWRGVCTRRLVRRYRDSEQIYDRLIAVKPDKFYKVELTHLIVIPTLVPSPTLSGCTSHQTDLIYRKSGLGADRFWDCPAPVDDASLRYWS